MFEWVGVSQLFFWFYIFFFEFFYWFLGGRVGVRPKLFFSSFVLESFPGALPVELIGVRAWVTDQIQQIIHAANQGRRSRNILQDLDW